MDDLIIGAGSVGQVLGLHLSDAGRHVGVLVRPSHAAQARSGYQLRRLRRLRGPVHGRFLKPPPAIARSAAGMRAALSALSLLAPFDLERYLRHHFTKVGEQTRLMLDDLIGEGAARGLPVTRLRRLRASLADGSR